MDRAGAVEYLARDPHVLMAAQVAAEFGIDPVMVLAERDEYREAVRVAAVLALYDARKAAEKRK